MVELLFPPAKPTPTEVTPTKVDKPKERKPAPPSEEFVDVLRRAQDGTAHKGLKRALQETGGGMGRTKVACMKWCLFEAKERIWQSRLRVATIFSINHDVNNGMLLCRVAGVGARVEVACVFLA